MACGSFKKRRKLNNYNVYTVCAVHITNFIMNESVFMYEKCHILCKFELIAVGRNKKKTHTKQITLKRAIAC